jgi:SSS family solute:Na+ symporter
MKAFTAKDDRTLRRTVVLYPTFQIFLVPLFLIGFAGVMFHTAPEKADQILPHMLMNMEIPAVLVGLFCAGALAASMSSGDAMAHAAASIAVRDGMVKALGLGWDEQRQRGWIRVAVIVVIVASYVLAVTYRGDLVNLLLWAYGPVGQFVPAVIAALYWRRATGTGVLAGMLAGGAVGTVASAIPAWKPFPDVHPGLYGVAVNVIVLLAVSLATRSRDPGHDADFLATASDG